MGFSLSTVLEVKTVQWQIVDSKIFTEMVNPVYPGYPGSVNPIYTGPGYSGPVNSHIYYTLNTQDLLTYLPTTQYL